MLRGRRGNRVSGHPPTVPLTCSFSPLSRAPERDDDRSQARAVAAAHVAQQMREPDVVTAVLVAASRYRDDLVDAGRERVRMPEIGVDGLATQPALGLFGEHPLAQLAAPMSVLVAPWHGSQPKADHRAAGPVWRDQATATALWVAAAAMTGAPPQAQAGTSSAAATTMSSAAATTGSSGSTARVVTNPSRVSRTCSIGFGRRYEVT